MVGRLLRCAGNDKRSEMKFELGLRLLPFDYTQGKLAWVVAMTEGISSGFYKVSSLN